MSSVFKRLTNIARSYVGSLSGENRRTKTFDGAYDRQSFDTDSSGFDFGEGQGASSGESYAHQNDFDTPRQVIEDLATFGLKPPSSLSEVKRARNREMKKYHSDRFLNDPEKLETSKEIMQIYNAAYDRLRSFYQNKSSQ